VPGGSDLFDTRLVIGRDSAGAHSVDAGDGPHPLIPIGRNTPFSRRRRATVRGAPGAPLQWSEPSGAFTLQRLADAAGTPSDTVTGST
jgi:hypothetical protein